MFSRAAIAPLEYTRKLWMRSWVGLTMLFLYAPLIVLMIFSFNDSKRNVVWKGFTLKYYEKALNNDSLVEALVNSLTIAFLATIVSLVIGALAAVMLWRFRFPFKGLVEGTMSLPIIVPEICLGVAFLIFFAKVQWPTDLIWPLNLSAITIAHITFCFPFVAMVVRARLASFNKEEEEAAKDLGATEWQAFRDVLLPHIKPGLVAGALLAFTLSLDDFVITFFTSGPDTITFPVKVYSMVRFSVTPEVNAASTLLILLTVILTFIALKLQGVKGIAETHYMTEPIIQIRNVSKRFGKVTAVDNVSLDILAGEFFVLLGPSGCGKTTLLRMIAGFEMPTEGQIIIDGQDMSLVPPNKRPVNMVFQSYAVFPHMNVTDNVGYGLRIAGVGKGEIKERVQESLELVKLGGFEDRMPDQMSGGQRQRVALARSLVMRPKVLLLDEPLSALDAKLRAQMQFELSELQEKVGITFVTVTHDQDEALSMACRIAVVNKGEIAQLAPPSDLYEYPANRFVADFVGSVNIFEGKLTLDEPDKAAVDCPGLGKVYLNHGVTGPHGADVWVALRPEKIYLHVPGEGKAIRAAAQDAPDGHNLARGTIKGMSYLGDITLYEIQLEGGQIIRVSRPNLSRHDQEDFTWDDKVSMHWRADSPVVLLS